MRALDIGARAGEVLDRLVAVEAGRISPSVYETSRLAVVAPNLTGQRERWEFLLAEQAADGRWGGPDSYWLVPTLSATAAVLHALNRPDRADTDTGLTVRLALAAHRALKALSAQGSVAPQDLPDTVAAEVLAPHLINQVNRLAAHVDVPSPVVVWGADAPTSAPVPGLMQGHCLPAKALHCLEAVADLDGNLLAGVTPSDGAIGCSPAATAAWLATGAGTLAERQAAESYLRRTVQHASGPVPSVTPVTVFERAWVLAALSRAGIGTRVPASLLNGLEQAVSGGATGGAPGLPPDADTTSTVLSVLHRHRRPQPIDPLFTFETDTHFCCWHGERTPSPTANAHVLTALACRNLYTSSDIPRIRSARAKIATWLCDQQTPAGYWTDKWHASPYYATARCTIALAHHGGPEARRAVGRALKWVMDGQKQNGSWGRWAGTAEESAYAVQTLLLAGDRRTNPLHHAAAARARTVLADALTSSATQPPLWHDKDLYAPEAIIEAEVLAAYQLTKKGLPARERPSEQLFGTPDLGGRPRRSPL